MSTAPPARVLLVHPTGGGPHLAPPSNLLYLAAALLRAGVSVRILDMASPRGPHTPEAVRDEAARWAPHVIGVTVFSELVLSAGRLAAVLRPLAALLVAGGPHATALPEEILALGYDAVVFGEGEDTLVELVDCASRGGDLSAVAGLRLPAPDGGVFATAARPYPRDLDALASPLSAADLVPRDRYVDDPTRALPASVLTSRGCPGRCTFCANVVSGRRYRAHSVARVIEDMSAWHDREGAVVFCFPDPTFTAHRGRLLALCEAMAALPFRPMWWCETRVDRLDGEMARAMAGAGCVNVVVGIESGDPGVQRRIGKHIDLDRAEQTLRVLQEAGLRTQVNFMFGFPDETAAELDNTLRYMERIAPLVDLFPPMGVWVPYPGSALYDRYHETHGFAGWWRDERLVERLNSAPGGLEPGPTVYDLVRWHAAVEQSVLDAGFVPYPADVRSAIERCLAFRRERNLAVWTAPGS